MSFFEKILLYQKRYRLVSHLLFWLAIMLVSISSSKYRDGREFTYQWAFIGNGLFLIPQLIASYFLTYWAVPRFFFRKQYILTFFTFLIGAYVICLLSRFLIVRVAEPMAGIPLKASETNLDLITDLPKLLYNYFFSIF